MSNRTWSDEDLVAAVPGNLTLLGVLRSLGLSTSPGNTRTVRKHIERLGIDTGHFIGKRYAPRGTPFQPMSISESFRYGSTLTNSSLKAKIRKHKLLVEQCNACGLLSTWQGMRLVLQLDHINGDPTDNRIENLRFLCPNCHSQTDTFRGRNRSSRYRAEHKCTDCGREVWKGSERCNVCDGKARTVIKWPSVEELKHLVIENSYSAVARSLGTTDNNVRRQLKKHLDTLPEKCRGRR